MIGRPLIPHVALLVVAVGASLFVWTRDKKPVTTPGTVTVWSARPDDVQRIVFETKGRKITLEGKSDAQGRFFSGTSDFTPPPAPAGADGGAPPMPPKTVTFVSVNQANKVAEALAPLKATREVGKLGDDRVAEFGLKDPEGTLTVSLAGKDRKLTLGAKTPGGGDRYVRDEASGIVYVLKGEVTRDLEGGDSSLSERDVHAFKDSELEGVKVLARGKSRELLRRGPEAKRIWSDPSDPDKQDETAANWLSKVERLRPTEYLVPQPTAPEMVARVEYKVKGAQGVFLEIAKIPGTTPASPPPNQTVSAPKPDYIVRSERTRYWGKVYGPVGEQVEQDLGSILR
jgi:hypothetical protein